MHPENKLFLIRMDFSLAGKRLIGAVVRAGIESDIFSNAACGLPVTDQASTPGAHIQFLCDPPVIAQYVSVDDKDHMNGHENNLITLCEVMVEEHPIEYCSQSTSKKKKKGQNNFRRQMKVKPCCFFNEEKDENKHCLIQHLIKNGKLTLLWQLLLIFG